MVTDRIEHVVVKLCLDIKRYIVNVYCVVLLFPRAYPPIYLYRQSILLYK